GSSFGYFRKGFTTTSALTHSMIPRSAVEGLIGAILGFPSDVYSDVLWDSKIAIEIRSPVRKLNMKYMHTNPDWWRHISLYLKNKTTSKKIQFAVPTSVEFLVNPIYRIYIDNEKINNFLSIKLKNKQSHFTPYLGSSSMIAFIKYIGEYSYKDIKLKDYQPIKSILYFLDRIPKLKLEKDLKFAIEDSLPIHIDKDRNLAGNYKVIYSPDAKDLMVNDDIVSKIDFVNNGNNKTYVKFLPIKITSQ
ncbi:MAG TPA: type I-B CRISPR-associated protein Cas5b, partial [Nitrososphaeraceae archaeon]|nr:type I-B CRISPR-associated protein Cas5b [Nitrososphaeraceae archaeon]